MLCNSWMRALQRTILHLHESDDGIPPHRPTAGTGVDHIGKPSLSTQDSLLVELRRVPGNDRCADCGDEGPKWASINLGVSFLLKLKVLTLLIKSAVNKFLTLFF